MTGKRITEEKDKFLEYQGWTGQNTKWVQIKQTSQKKKKATTKTKVQDQMFSLDSLSTI